MKTINDNFFEKLQEYVLPRTTGLRFKNRTSQNDYDIDFGFPKLHISCKIAPTKNKLRCEIDIPNAKYIYERLLKSRQKIEKDFNEPLQWKDKAKKVRRIRITRYDFDIDDTSKWDEYFKWETAKIIKFQKILGRKYQNLLPAPKRLNF